MIVLLSVSSSRAFALPAGRPTQAASCAVTSLACMAGPHTLRQVLRKITQLSNIHRVPANTVRLIARTQFLPLELTLSPMHGVETDRGLTAFAPVTERLSEKKFCLTRSPAKSRYATEVFPEEYPLPRFCVQTMLRHSLKNQPLPSTGHAIPTVGKKLLCRLPDRHPPQAWRLVTHGRPTTEMGLTASAWYVGRCVSVIRCKQCAQQSMLPSLSHPPPDPSKNRSFA